MKSAVLVPEGARLADVVTGFLKDAGHPEPAAWADGLHPDAALTTDRSVEQFLVNRQLRLVLGNAPESTTNARYCLLETHAGTTEDWARSVKQGVIPCMVQQNLPVQPAMA